jgi:ADP-ribose pyrophosphatase YjhB (NUDIX family)
MPVTLRKNDHCSYCGHRFVQEDPWPRTCAGCRQISYLNPLPIAVVLLPVDDGLLCIRRSIEPFIGHLALPGGFMDVDETWQEAAARELWEETGIRVAAEEMRLFDVLGRSDPYLVLFGLAPHHTSSSLPAYTVTNETSERLVVDEPVELAFPVHTQAMREFFVRKGRPG